MNHDVSIVGEILIEKYNENVESLGGVLHAARFLKNVECGFNILYSYPRQCCGEYLSKTIDMFDSIPIAMYDDIDDSFKVHDPEELQLDNQYGSSSNGIALIKIIQTNEITGSLNKNVLFFPFRDQSLNDLFLNLMLKETYNVFIDINYLDTNLIELLKKFPHENLTIFCSVNNNLQENVTKVQESSHYKYFVEKHNRGGSIIYSENDKRKINIPAFISRNYTSVGVGDVYNAAFLYYTKEGIDIEKAGRFSSYISKLYGENHGDCFFDDSIKKKISRIENYAIIKGHFLPFSKRKLMTIYLAGPDFSSMPCCRKIISDLDEILKSHNFNVIRPIIKNGEYQKEDCTLEQEIKLYEKDREDIEDSHLCLAALLSNDQGTLVEIGFFSQLEKPIIVFDPYNLIDNMFLRNSVSTVENSYEDVLNKIYMKFSQVL